MHIFDKRSLILCIKFHNIKNINANDHKTLTQVLVNHNIPMIFLTKIMKMYVSSIIFLRGTGCLNKVNI